MMFRSDIISLEEKRYFVQQLFDKWRLQSFWWLCTCLNLRFHDGRHRARSINTGTLTPSNRLRFLRHHHRHLLLCDCPRPLHLLPPLALVAGGGHRRLASGQESLGRSILSRSSLDVVCSCPMVRLTRFLRVRFRSSSAST